MRFLKENIVIILIGLLITAFFVLLLKAESNDRRREEAGQRTRHIQSIDGRGRVYHYELVCVGGVYYVERGAQGVAPLFGQDSKVVLCPDNFGREAK